MPTYEYECTQCGGHFDIFQRMSDLPQKTCDVCGGALTKLLSTGSGLIFKGSGFYITDYKNAGAAGEKSEKGEKTDKGGKGEKGPAEKSESKKVDSKAGETAGASGTGGKPAPASSGEKTGGSTAPSKASE